MGGQLQFLQGVDLEVAVNSAGQFFPDAGDRAEQIFGRNLTLQSLKKV